MENLASTMWKLLVTLSVFIVSTPFIGTCKVDCMENWQNINGSSEVITSIIRTNCYNRCYFPGHCYKCERSLILNLQNLSKISPTVFGSPADFKKVTFSYCGQNCKPVETTRELFHNLSSLQQLDIECVKLTPSWSSPKTMESLDKLTLRRMEFSLDTEEFLSSFPNIRYLSLVDVPVSVVTLNTFPVKYLENLVLQKNNFEVIEDRSFQQFHHLSRLTIRDNPLVHLKMEMFSGLGNLYSLELDNNKIAVLRNKTFSALTRLVLLNLSGNQISDIESGAFSDLPMIKDLWLNNNQLENVPNGLFKNLSSLVWLSLASNKLSTVGPNDFKGLGKVDLDLSCNYIHRIDPYAFRTLNLRFLRLESNRLEVITANSFDGLYVENTVNLQFNNITKIENDGFRNLKAANLTIECNNITKVEKYWGLHQSVILQYDDFWCEDPMC